MSLPRWDDEMKFELLRLKSELRPENFRVLHTPMGIGLPTKSSPSPQTSAVNLPHLQKNSPRPHPQQAAAQKYPSNIQASSPVSKPSRFSAAGKASSVTYAKSRPSGFSRKLSTLFLVHAFDVLFLLLTLGLGLLLATWFIDPKNFSDNPELLKQSLPFRLLIQSNAYVLVLGLYAFFSVYWLFFKLVSGSTLGESFFGNFTTLQKTRERASVKDSGDS